MDVDLQIRIHAYVKALQNRLPENSYILAMRASSYIKDFFKVPEATSDVIDGYVIAL